MTNSKETNSTTNDKYLLEQLANGELTQHPVDNLIGRVANKISAFRRSETNTDDLELSYNLDSVQHPKLNIDPNKITLFGNAQTELNIATAAYERIKLQPRKITPIENLGDQKNSMISAVDNLEVEVLGESNFEKLTQFASSSFQRVLSDAKKVIERDELTAPIPAKTLEKDHFNLLK
jgi:hypothetical protein